MGNFLKYLYFYSFIFLNIDQLVKHSMNFPHLTLVAKFEEIYLTAFQFPLPIERSKRTADKRKKGENQNR